MSSIDELPGGRGRAVAIAYHVLGSVTDAEDAVQEATESWLTTNRDAVDDPEAWAAVVTTRRAIDVLRQRDRRREDYVGPWLPEPRIRPLPHAQGPDQDPASAAAVADEVSYALLVVLDRLTPEQRIAFVLHDVFGESFHHVAAVLDRTPAAARQLASRARRQVRESAPPDDVDDGQRWHVAEVFVDAAQRGDLTALLDLLDPDVQLVADSGGKVRAPRNVVRGPDHVGRFAIGVLRGVPRDQLRPVLVGGDPGVVATIDGRTAVGVLEVRHGLVTAVRLVANPDKLTHLPG